MSNEIFDLGEYLTKKKKKLQVETQKIIKVKKTPVIKSKKTQKKKELKKDYEPSSDEMRTAIYLLTHKSNRDSKAVIKKALKKLTQDW